MRAPSFWWRRAGVAAGLMAPFAAVYGMIAAARLGRPGVAPGIPVMCIGNLTVGGAGKTPTALAVARLLAAAGERPVFLSRGYGGRLAGPVQVDPRRHGATDVGDEPLLLARAAPAIVARDRVAGARAAVAAGATVIVMDDGFQNPSLRKDAVLLVIDGRRGIGNGRVLPAGPLRAPLAHQLARADAILVIGEAPAAAAVMAAARGLGLKVFHGRLTPDPAAVAAVGARKVLAFAGIGDPDKFFAMLAEAGIEAPIRRAFSDHHGYTPEEAAGIAADAARHGLLPLTTEKDFVRLSGTLADCTQVLPVAIEVDEPEDFRRFVLGVVAAA
ncbi:MAG: tetraacyldisaccharide 4'-kinase [Xanthobacteraceae bacterium]